MEKEDQHSEPSSSAIVFKVPHRPSKPAFCSIAGEICREFSPYGFSQVMILFFQRGGLQQSIIYISKYGIGYR
jgi:hypothetical protein